MTTTNEKKCKSNEASKREENQKNPPERHKKQKKRESKGTGAKAKRKRKREKVMPDVGIEPLTYKTYFYYSNNHVQIDYHLVHQCRW